MNTILMRITTKMLDKIEKDNTQNYILTENNYGIYYNHKLNLINHYYCEHKIFSVNFDEKLIKFIDFKSRLTRIQQAYLFKFYEKFNFKIMEIKL